MLPRGVRPVIVASHRRSGTHLMLDLLRRQFPACCPPFRFGVNPHRYLYFVLDRLRYDHQHHTGVESFDRVVASTPMPLLKTHASPDFSGCSADAQARCRAALDHGVAIYCVRDVRAVLASLHSFEAVTDPAARTAFSEYIYKEIDGKPLPRVWADHVRSWTESGTGCHVVKFEDIVADPDATLEHLSAVLGQDPLGVQPILPPKLRHRQRLWIARVTGIPQSTNVIGRTRHVSMRDWRTAYSKADFAWLEQHAGDTMRSLGYLEGDDWSLEST